MTPQHSLIQFTPRRVAGVLGTVALLLIIANLGVIFVRVGLGHPWFFGINRLFDVNGESNIPALFSVGLLLVNSLLLFAVGRTERQRGNRISCRGWLILACVFSFLAIDEAASIHETFMAVIKGRLETTGVFYYAWVIPYGIAVVVLAAILVPWFIKLPRNTKLLFIAAGSLYVFGALGMEMISGRYFESVRFETNLVYQLLSALEESLEMLGQILFAYGLIAFLQDQGGIRITLEIQRDERASEQSLAADAPVKALSR